MKKQIILSLAPVACALLAGCVSRNEMAMDTVGPEPATSAVSTSNSGTLIVYSAYDPSADFNKRDVMRPEYTDYRILTVDGQLFKRVHNNTGSMQQRALPQTLSQGKYEVVAQADGNGVVTVPVTVEAGKTTVVHLEGGNTWSADPRPADAEAAHLPDGTIIGWKARMD